MESATIYLFSSNSRLKYFEDCLRALMLPREMVMHFRYRTSHLNSALVAAIASCAAVGKSVLVSYLYQEYDGTTWMPKSAKPLRFGVITEARLDGPTAHLFFRVTGYANELSALGADAEQAMRSDEGLKYGVLGSADKRSCESKEDSDASAFIAIVESFTQLELRASFTGDGALEQMDPLFVRIEGLFRKGKSGLVVITPVQLGPSDRLRGYKITSDDPLELRIRFHQPKWSRVDRKSYSLSLDVDPSYFAVPAHESIRIASPYDVTEFLLLPLRTNVAWLTRIAVTSSSEGENAIGNIVSFSALTEGTPHVWPWVTAIVEAATPLVAILLAVASTVIAVTKTPTNDGIPTVVWIIWAVASIFVVMGATKSLRSR
jgi:hypothetical protein